MAWNPLVPMLDFGGILDVQNRGILFTEWKITGETGIFKNSMDCYVRHAFQYITLLKVRGSINLEGVHSTQEPLVTEQHLWDMPNTCDKY